MENAFVEEVAASLVREFLSKKGLKKTSTTMDEEFPRTALSINNRNELRNILHLQSLYKMNKAKENPLKTILEIMTNYFLEHTSSTKDVKKSPSVLQNKSSQPRSTDNLAFKKSLPEEATCKLPERNKTEAYRYCPHCGHALEAVIYLYPVHRGVRQEMEKQQNLPQTKEKFTLTGDSPCSREKNGQI